MNISNGATVLVTGVTGAVGPRVVDTLSAAGYHVRTLSLDRPEDGRRTVTSRRALAM
jgi:nucleoside-diphosphate-sugar epimerase